jgi:hypothetical protein
MDHHILINSHSNKSTTYELGKTEPEDIRVTAALSTQQYKWSAWSVFKRPHFVKCTTRS